MSKAFGELPSNLLLISSEIWPRLRDLIANAEKSVDFLFYKIENNSDAFLKIYEGLAKLSSTSSGSRDTPPKVRFCINKRSGLAGIVKPYNPEISTPVPILGRPELSGISCQAYEHNHSLFGSSHGKMVIIDQKTIVLISGDPTKSSNYQTAGSNPWVESATVIHSDHPIQMTSKYFEKILKDSTLIYQREGSRPQGKRI